MRGGPGLRADILKFDNNDDGNAHAKRVASLKPGDEVYWKAEGREPVKGYYVGPDSGKAVLLYYDNSEEYGVPWCVGIHPWGCLRFADQL